MNKNNRTAFVTDIGSILQITEDWECSIFNESRNEKLINADGYKYDYCSIDCDKLYTRTFPKDTKFLVDRIYIRNNAKKYSSVSLKVLETTDKNILNNCKKSKATGSYCRFWVKLSDFNNANMSVVEDAGAEVDQKYGKPITLKQLETRKYIFGYAVFKHSDPELSFEGEVRLRRLENFEHEKGSDDPFCGSIRKDCYTKSEHVWQRHVGGFLTPTKVKNVTFVSYTSDYHFIQVAPSSLIYNTPTPHPLVGDLCFPKDKNELKKMGLVSKIDTCVDLPIAGGLLTLYDEV